MRRRVVVAAAAAACLLVGPVAVLLLGAYPHPEVAKVGAELDPLFGKIAAVAVTAR